MAQVVENAHEDNEVEALAELANLVDRHLPKVDVQACLLCGETRLSQIARIRINAEYPAGIAPFHLETVKPGIAADIEDASTLKILRNDIAKLPPLEGWVI